jgi:hypothetical protein
MLKRSIIGAEKFMKTEFESILTIDEERPPFAVRKRLDALGPRLKLIKKLGFNKSCVTPIEGTLLKIARPPTEALHPPKRGEPWEFLGKVPTQG